MHHVGVICLLSFVCMAAASEWKRDWNELSGMWGKRGWNDLSGMWGKRGWNDLSGMWGKRAAPRRNPGTPPDFDWHSLAGGWGRREAERRHNLMADSSNVDEAR